MRIAEGREGGLMDDLQERMRRAVAEHERVFSISRRLISDAHELRRQIEATRDREAANILRQTKKRMLAI
jgi:hypothetical protein